MIKTYSSGQSDNIKLTARGFICINSADVEGSVRVLDGSDVLQTIHLGRLPFIGQVGPFGRQVSIEIMVRSGPAGVVNIDVSGADVAAFSAASSPTGPVVVASNGYPASKIVGGNTVKFKLANTASFSAIGANNTFNQRWSTWVSGEVEVRFIFEFGNPAEFTISTSQFAVSAGRDGAEHNPLNPDGSNASWVITPSGITLPIADPGYETNGKISRGVSPWFELSVPEGGAIYARTILPTTQMGTVGNNTAGSGRRAISDWQQYINLKYPKLKYWANFAAGAFAVSNQTAMPATGNPSQFSPVVGIEVRPRNTRKTVTVDAVGDSTTQELWTGTVGTDGYKPFNSSWINGIVNKRINAGLPWGFGNYGYEGKPAAHFLGRYLQLCTNNIEASGEICFLQIFSINGGGFDDSIIDANIVLANQITALRKAAGKITIWRTTFPVIGAIPAQVLAWTRGNRLIRQSDNYVFDAALAGIVTADNTHLTLADQDKVIDLGDNYLVSIGI